MNHRLFLLPFLLLPTLRAELPDLPAGVTSFGAAFHDGAIHVLGGHLGKPHGYSRDEVFQPLLRLSLEAKSAWEEWPADEPSLGPALLAHPSGLIRLGGMQPRNPKGAPDDLWSITRVSRFHPATRTWSPLPDLPEPRSSHDACVLGDSVFVAGGWTMRGPEQAPVWSETVLRLDLSAAAPAWENIPQPFQRRALAVAATPGRLHVLGGLTADGETSLRVDVLELATETWSRGPDLPDGPVKGFGLAAAAIGEDVYVTGFSGFVHRLDAANGRWEEAATLATGRMFPRLLVLDPARLLVIGGSGKGGHVLELETVALDRQASAGPAPVEVWRRNLGPGLSGFAFHGETALTVGHRDDSDHIQAIALATGEERWAHDYPAPLAAHSHPIVPGGPASAPLVSGNHVFTLARDGHLHALDATDGTVLWETHLVADLGGVRPEYGYASRPVVHEGLLFVDAGGPGASTVALEAATGAVRWKAGDRAAGYAILSVAAPGGLPTLLVFKADALVGLDPTDGAERWSLPWTTREGINAANPLLLADDAVILSSTTGGLARFPLPGSPSGTTWRIADTGMLFNAPFLHDSSLFGFNDNRRDAGEFFCRDPATGDARWVSDECDKGSFLLSPDGTLITLSSKGELTLARVTASGLDPLHRLQALGGRCYPPVAESGAYLLCRNNDGETVCFRR